MKESAEVESAGIVLLALIIVLFLIPETRMCLIQVLNWACEGVSAIKG